MQMTISRHLSESLLAMVCADHDDGHQTVKNKRGVRKNNMITGCRPETYLHSFHGVKKKAVVCVSRLDQGTSVEAVKNFLTSNGIAMNSCYSVGSTDTEINGDDTLARRNSRLYITMCVCVFHADLNKVLCPELWPDGVTVRPWVFKTRRDHKVKSDV